MADEPKKRRPCARRAITPTAAQLARTSELAPVPRQKQRCDGSSYERQRAFIQAFAETGTVARAAQAIGMTAVGAYNLRRQPAPRASRRPGRMRWRSASGASPTC